MTSVGRRDVEMRSAPVFDSKFQLVRSSQNPLNPSHSLPSFASPVVDGQRDVTGHGIRLLVVGDWTRPSTDARTYSLSRRR